MPKSGCIFHNTPETLAEWRMARSCTDVTKIIEFHQNNPNLILNRETYHFLLSFFNLELLIPNSQLPAITRSIVVNEVHLANEGLVAAIIFLHHDNFPSLIQYSRYILQSYLISEKSC